MLWVAFALLSLLVLGFVGWPMVRPRPAEEPSAPAYDLEVYRDQLKELANDRDRGLLTPGEADAARLEVERRMLKAASERATVELRQSGQRRWIAGLIALGVPAAAMALYLDLGSPWLTDHAARSRPAHAAQSGGEAAPPGQTAAQAEADAQAQALTPMVERLAARLKEQPDDPDGWLMLARSYWELERYGDAAAAYNKASTLMPANADLKMAEGEAIVFAAQGLVTPAAKAAFLASFGIDAKHPGARYYLGLERLQAGDPASALAAWQALEADAPEGAPWLEQLRERIEQAKQMAANLPGGGTMPPNHPPVPAPATPAPAAAAPAPAPTQQAQAAPTPPAAAAPGPTAADVAAAAELTAEDRAAFIQSMVDRLAARLESEPNDLEGWLRLGRAYGVLGQNDKSVSAYEKAVALAPADQRASAGLAEAKARLAQ